MKTWLYILLVATVATVVAQNRFTGKVIQDEYISCFSDYPEYPGIYILRFETEVTAEDFPFNIDIYNYTYKIVTSIYSTQRVKPVILKINNKFETGYLANKMLKEVYNEGYDSGKCTYAKKVLYICGGMCCGYLLGRGYHVETFLGFITITAIGELLI